uniref:Transcription elongation factor, mitochondrial n=1 Tax=Mus spicilegus TaxID=10103 RepID=A0A8C6GNM4_MUSSI
MAWRTNLACLIKAGGRRWFPVPEYSSLPPVLNNTCSVRKSTAPEKRVASVAACDTDGKEPRNALDRLFSLEQQASILQVLNTASDKELEAFRLLRGRKSVNIVEHRKKFGPFQRRRKKSQEKWLLRKFIKPGVEQERLKAVKSIVSIVFGTRRIAWAHLDRRPTVLDWQQTECWKLTNKTYPTSFYLEEISSVISKIPKADLYILEKSGLSIQNTSLLPILLHFLITEAMLYALLNKTFAEDGQHRVLSINRNAVGKHFDLMIGDTRTSGRELVKQFLSESVLKERPRVFFPQDLLVQYRQKVVKSSYRIEELYDSLLQAVAFYELVFGKDSELKC